MSAKGTTEIVEPTRAQQQLARRVAESRATVPDLTLATEALVAHDGAPRALAVRALALALREQPELNAAYRDGRFERYSRVNVGVVLDDGDALVTPTVFDADTKPLAAIDAEIAALAGAQLAAPQTAGATCTVVALEGVRRVVPPLSAPHATALGVGDMADRAIVRDGVVIAATVVELTLVCDHRIAYGARAAALLARVRELLEDATAPL